jgi:hypothetical protein
LAEHAERLHDGWDLKEDSIRAAILDRGAVLSAKSLSDAVKAAAEAWQALETWAKDPLKEASEKVFLKRSEVQ